MRQPPDPRPASRQASDRGAAPDPRVFGSGRNRDGIVLPLTGAVVAIAVAVVTLGSVAVVLAQGTGFALMSADWIAVRFTVLQAAVSALVSVILAVPVARALARRRFVGRGVLVTALGAPFLLPVIVAVLGLLAVFGRNGALNSGLGALGLPAISIYGFHGVILAHVFLNLPLVVRMILQGWQAIPAERVRVAQSLGFGPGDIARHLERPMLRAVLPGAGLAVFLICLTSFAVALILGGGPRATTVELAIFQAIRFDFDLGRAAVLASVQFGLCAVAVLVAGRVTIPSGLGVGLDRPLVLPAPCGWRRWVDAVAIALAAGFLLAPLMTVAARGVSGLTDLPVAVWQAAGRSVMLALVSTGVTIAATLTLAQAVIRGGRLGRLAELAGMLPLAASSLVLGVGIFLAVLPFANPARLALPVTALVNATLALPFALRLILPALREIEMTQGRLAQSLGMTGLQRLRLVTVPRLRRPLGFAAGLVAALAMGDLGVIALFATEQSQTLPLQIWRLMGAYRTELAEAAALLLVALSFGLFMIFDHWGRRNAGS
ncbi:MAG: thiamine/thiamine pyrophosphate ABC transporter permease ThiP [Gemmobacter sp.]|nr:thiamine/thiamine pyrophosphate ABC transporter permease ThiP [Gemmobacter sp.]